MSLVHTCELCGANPFDYLTELDRHAAELSAPQDWMPWNYRKRWRGWEMPKRRPKKIVTRPMLRHRLASAVATHEARID